jgi:hypothetical protein
MFQSKVCWSTWLHWLTNIFSEMDLANITTNKWPLLSAAPLQNQIAKKLTGSEGEQGEVSSRPTIKALSIACHLTGSGLERFCRRNPRITLERLPERAFKQPVL